MQDGDFSASTLENMEFYKEALIDTIPDGLELTMSNGLFYYPQDSRINKNITRLNNYILLKAKMEGKKPSQISEEILATDFPMFNIKGQEPKAPVVEPTIKNKVITQEEYDKLKPNEEYTDPNGVIRIKQ